MRVIFQEKPIIIQIEQAIEQAEIDDKSIGVIFLNTHEYNEFQRDCKSMGPQKLEEEKGAKCQGGDVVEYKGVPIRWNSN